MHDWDTAADVWICRTCGQRVNPARVDVSTLPGCVPPAPPPEPLPPERPDPPVTAEPRTLAATCNYFNPLGYRSLRENYLRFVHEFAHWGVPLYVCEVLYDGQLPALTDPPDGVYVHQFRASDQHLVWQKERLVNWVAERLPPDVDSLAWIDADVTLFNRHWATETLEQLRRWSVVQLWGRWHFLRPDGAIIQTGHNVSRWAERFLLHLGNCNYAHPGGAWAGRRDVFPLYDRHALGGGDQHAIEAWTDDRDTFLQGQCSPAWLASYRTWADAAYATVQGRVGVITGDMVHHYHGTRANRGYASRSQLLTSNGFDPERDLQVDANGLLAWTDAAPRELRDAVRGYFLARQEDDGYDA